MRLKREHQLLNNLIKEDRTGKRQKHNEAISHTQT